MYSTIYDSESKLWKGPNILPLYNPQISLAQVLLSALTTYGSKIAQISDDSGIRMSFDEIRIKMIRVAQNLQECGYQPKQVFGFLVKNSHHIAPIIFASISIGCLVNTLDPSFKKAEIIHILKLTKPVLMFCDVENYELLRECLTELKNCAKIFTFGGSNGDSEQIETLFGKTHNESDFIPLQVDGTKDTAMIVCSSGTSGISKGVCLSHAALLEMMAQLNVCNASDVMLCFSSIYWLSGVIVLIKGTLSGSTRIITTEIFSPELQLRLIEKYKVTFALNSPYQLNLLIANDSFPKMDLSSLKIQLIGGAKAPIYLINRLCHHLPNGKVLVAYGMSEIAGYISVHQYDGTIEKETVGKLASGSCVKIVDDHGNRCGINVNGEICMKVNYKFFGYYGNQKATDDLFDGEGFISSGDIGHFDDQGYLYIVDRKKDLLKYCNYQISPTEIDAFLIESPKIRLACVVGIPNEMCGDLPAAVIVRSQEFTITEKDVSDMIADNFADYCRLRGGVYFVDTLPTTPSGKILRRKVKEMAIDLFVKRNA